MKRQGRAWQASVLAVAGCCAVVLGVVLFLVNLAGFVRPLRAPEVTGYIDFAGAATRSAEDTLARLSAIPISASPFETASLATRIVHDGIAHISPADVASNGHEHYRMRIPATENWVLFLLSIVKPDTYGDYEFCSYRKAIERGTGRCGQQALTLVSFLEERGLETGFVALGGHAIATARTEEAGWVLLDPDYGGVIPFSLQQAEDDPVSVLPHYWSAAARENRVDTLYAPEANELKPGGVAARYPRACPIEKAAYLLKWWAPALLLAFGAGLITLARRRGSAAGSGDSATAAA